MTYHVATPLMPQTDQDFQPSNGTPTYSVYQNDSKEKTIAALIRWKLESPGALLLAIGEHQTEYTNLLNSCIAACHRVLSK